MTRLDSIQDGCWVNLTYPSEDELNTVAATLAVEPTFLRAALDEEETSRIDTEDGQTLLIIDVPSVEKDDAVVYSTLPLGIIVTEKHIITVFRQPYRALAIAWVPLTNWMRTRAASVPKIWA